MNSIAQNNKFFLRSCQIRPLAFFPEPNEVVRTHEEVRSTPLKQGVEPWFAIGAVSGSTASKMPIPAPAAPGGQPPQPPFGQTQATGSTPNKGYEAAGLQELGVLVKQMEKLLPQLGASSEPGQAVLKALNSLVKFVPAGSVTPAAQKNSIEAQQRQMAQNNQQMQAVQQMRQKQAPPQGGQPPGMGAAA